MRLGVALGVRRRIGWFGQCRLAQVRERSFARAAVGAARKPIQFRRAPLHLANCFQRHRLRDFSARDLLQLPPNFKVLFLQGGASLQFSMVPITFLAAGETADYVVTGFWGLKALTEARRCGIVNVVSTTA